MAYPAGDQLFWESMHVTADDENDRIAAPNDQTH